MIDQSCVMNYELWLNRFNLKHFFFIFEAVTPSIIITSRSWIGRYLNLSHGNCCRELSWIIIKACISIIYILYLYDYRIHLLPINQTIKDNIDLLWISGYYNSQKLLKIFKNLTQLLLIYRLVTHIIYYYQ